MNTTWTEMGDTCVSLRRVAKVKRGKRGWERIEHDRRRGGMGWRGEGGMGLDRRRVSERK